MRKCELHGFPSTDLERINQILISAEVDGNYVCNKQDAEVEN